MSLNLAQPGGDADGRVAGLAQGIAERLGSEPDLDDFLAWTAGTLEYWIHIVASSVAARHGWASRTEVPYVTAAPNPGTKSNIKWADGAMLLDDLGVLLEVKTIAAREHVAGPTLRKVPARLRCARGAGLEGNRASGPGPVLGDGVGRPTGGYGTGGAAPTGANTRAPGTTASGGNGHDDRPRGRDRSVSPAERARPD